MVEVGVRELKSGLSRYLRRVANGERVRVTMRGKPVADIVPAAKAGSHDPWWDLVADGTVTPATVARPSEPPPLGRAASPSASALILAEREAER